MLSASGQAGHFPELQGAFSKALQQLLQEKHQYQRVAIPDPGAEEGSLLATAYWHPEGSKGAEFPGAVGQSFALLPVKVWCGECQGTTPHKPDILRCRSIYHGSAAEHAMLLSYKCQDCAKRRVTFFVTRRGTTLELSGRDPLDTVNVPSSLPRAVSRFYTEAQVAHNTGQPLAALCLLREFIEQFWLRLPEVQEALNLDPRMNINEIGALYLGLLPLDFKAQYPNLMQCYQMLQAAIQGSAVRPDVFEFCSSEIVDHLDGRRFRRLEGSTASPFGEIHPKLNRQAVI